MCQICLLLDKGKITNREARKATWEQVQIVETAEEVDHLQKLYYDLLDEEEKGS